MKFFKFFNGKNEISSVINNNENKINESINNKGIKIPLKNRNFSN